VIIPLLTYLLLFIVPLIVVPGISLRFEPPKVLVAELLIQALAVYIIMSGKFAFKTVSRVLIGALGLLFLLSLFHLILNPTEANLFGNIFRLQGTILFWHLLVLTLIAQSLYFRLNSRYIYLCSFIAVLIGGLIYGSNANGRWIGSLGEPNAFGAIIILMFPFVFLGARSIWIRTIALIGASGVIYFSQSRSALIAFCLQLLFMILVKIFQGRQLLASIVCLFLLVCSLSLPILEREYFLRTNTDPFAFRFEDRAEIWKVAVNAGLNSPIYGTGLESIQLQIKETAQKMNANVQYQTIDSAHNLLLDIWIWGGSIGLILLITLIILTFKNLITKKLTLEATVFIGLLSVMSFNPTTVSVLAGFWWIIGRSFSKNIE